MKYLILSLLFLITGKAFSQIECNGDTIEIIEDKFYDYKMLASKPMQVIDLQSGYIIMTGIEKMKSGIYFRVICSPIDKSGDRCVYNGGSSIFLLENGEKVSISNNNDFNCDGVYNFSPTRKMISSLSGSPITDIRLFNGKRHIDLNMQEIDTSFGERFMNQMSCIQKMDIDNY